jgi:apolipoprotein N-acyltransferase
LRTKLTDIVFAVLCGVLTALAFPKIGLPFFAWISLIPLFFITSRRTAKSSFLIGIVAGTFFYGVLLYWVPSVPAHYGHLSTFLSILVYLFLIVLLALVWALFWALFARIHRSYPEMAYLAAPFLWVAFEYILTNILTGFPWGVLGLSQFKNLSFIQTASITGIYGISFVLVLFQSLFVYAINAVKRWPFACAIILMVVLHLGGFLSLKKVAVTEESFTASVVQGNVSSDINWHEVSTQDILKLFEEHMELSQKSYEKGAQLIIWPEFSVPLCFGCEDALYQNFKRILFQFARDSQCTLLLGTNEATGPPDQRLYHNTALCLAPDFAISTYYKMHLVPFGEYTPYKKIFRFIEEVTHAIGEITPGTEPVLHTFKNLKFGSPICYEIIFPDLVRRFTKKGANFLVTITNDGWYGNTSAPYQHFANAVFRAVENRRFVLRAATTGISGLIDPYGRILAQSTIGTQTFLTGTVTPSNQLTFYARFGNAFSYLCLTLAVTAFILALLKRRP